MKTRTRVLFLTHANTWERQEWNYEKKLRIERRANIFWNELTTKWLGSSECIVSSGLPTNPSTALLPGAVDHPWPTWPPHLSTTLLPAAVDHPWPTCPPLQGVTPSNSGSPLAYLPTPSMRYSQQRWITLGLPAHPSTALLPAAGDHPWPTHPSKALLPEAVGSITQHIKLYTNNLFADEKEALILLLLFSFLLLFALLLIEVGNAMLRQIDLHPISPKTPAPQ